jgi:hypothetical protein
VQVDHEERDDDAVPERVGHAAGLEQPDRPRQLRFQTLEIGGGFQCGKRVLPNLCAAKRADPASGDR